MVKLNATVTELEVKYLKAEKMVATLNEKVARLKRYKPGSSILEKETYTLAKWSGRLSVLEEILADIIE